MRESALLGENPGVRSLHRKRIVGACLGIAASWLIWLAPNPEGLTPIGHAVVAILLLTVIFWAFGVLGNAVTTIMMLGLMILAGVRPEQALGAFAGAPFWIVLMVLFYGSAMQSTGLAKRLSFLILSWFPPSYAGIMCAFFVIGLVLSPAIPSMTVRTAIMVPIAWALVQALDLKPRGRGSALILLSSVEMAVVPGCATLYGSLWGPVMVQLFSSQGYQLRWMAYAQALALPTVAWSLLLLAGNWLALRPERRLAVGKEFVRSELARMGQISRAEVVIAVVVAASIAYWVAERWHHLPNYVVGMLGLVALAAFGILKEKDFATAVSWPLVLFLGGVFALSGIVQQSGVTDWLAGYIVPVIQQVAGSPLSLVIVMALAMFAFKFMDPAGFLAMTVLFLPISKLMRGSPVSPLVLIAALLLACHPFWATYQNIWVAMSEGMTGNRAFEGAQRIRLANVYAVVTLIALALSVSYWWALGLLGG